MKNFFTLTWHGIAQVIVGGAHYLNLVEPIIPPNYKPLAAAILVILQFVLHQKALNSPQPN